MNFEEPAVTTVDSATTEEQQQPVFDAADPHSWSPAQRDDWNKTGNQPVKADSATAPQKKDKTAAPDSAPDSKKTASASDSATEDKSQKPHLKTKEDSEKRYQDLLDRAKKAEERAEAAERARTQPEKRDDKQVSQPVREEYKPLHDKKYFAENPGKTYEDFVRAAARHEAKWEADIQVKQAIAAERQRFSQEAATRELTTKLEEAKQRYPDVQEKVVAATGTIFNDQQIPFAVKALLNESDVLVDLMYVLQADAGEFSQFLQLARTQPGAALRKIALTESLVKEQLRAGKSTTAARGDDGKFVKTDTEKDVTARKEAPAETKPRAPKPPSEVGGRGTAPEDALKEAAKAGKFGDFEAEMNRRRQASRS